MTDDLPARIERVRARIAAAAHRAGRPGDAITLVAVTKGHPPEVVAAAVRCGLRDLGENRVQEGVAKVEALSALEPVPSWHLIGHLQGNKVQAALDHFDVIHSVDSERLLRRLDRLAIAPFEVFIEVNVGGEAAKYGVGEAETPSLAELARKLPNIRLRGLMTVAPLVADPEDARPHFRRLAGLSAALGLAELSMGMTNDFEVAIEEGATVVRVGRALFGPAG